MIGLDDTILAGNARAAAAFGIALDGPDRKKFKSVATGSRISALPAVVAAAQGGAAPVTITEVSWDSPGSPTYLDVLVHGVRDDADVLVAVLVTAVESAGPGTAVAREELRALDEELQERDDRLRRQREQLETAELASERKNQFLAMLAHELRNPLSTAVNALHIVRRRSGDNRDVHRAVELGQRQLRQVARLLDDLLDVSRIVLGKIHLHLQLVDLRELVARTVEATQLASRTQAQALTVELPDTPLLVRGDPTRLEQCLTNVLGNAVKFTPTGGDIRVTARAQDDWALVVIRDAGVGIAPEMLSQVFDLFSQADSSLARTRGGLGIGLTLTRRLVELQGGTVDVHSEGLGRGSEFEIRLPLQAGAASWTDETPAATTAPRRVLVVEDNRDLRETLCAVLRMQGHTVRDTGDGAAAVRLAVEWAPDVALLDLGMPDIDGYEVACRIRRRVGALIRLVALTGYSNSETSRDIARAGFAAHLVKPASPEELERLLATL
jgi:signal transduction histidine kinase